MDSAPRSLPRRWAPRAASVSVALLTLGGVCAWNPWHLAALYALVGVAAPLIGVAVPLAAAALVQTAVALRQPVRRRGGRFAVAALVVVSAGAVWAVLTYGLLAVLLISWPD